MGYHLFRSGHGRDPLASEHAELSVVTILIVAACAALVVCPALVALTYGWDYRLAVMLGAVLATALGLFGSRRMPAAGVADRLSLVFAGALAAVLFCTYASDWLDWRPLGIDDALAGMTIGLILLVVGPARLALKHERSVPGAADVALVAVALGQMMWTARVSDFYYFMFFNRENASLILILGLGGVLAFTALAFVFALHRKLRRTAVVLSVFVGLVVFLLVSKSAGEGPPAAYAGVAAAGCLLLVTAVAWSTSASAPARPAGLLLFLAVASVVALKARMQLAYALPTVTIGLWFWFSSYRRGFPFLARGPERISWRQPLLQLALFAGFGVTVGAHLLLLEAAAENKTGPQVLAGLEAWNLYQVSDVTFARALLADPYLWRDSISLTAGTTTDPEWVVKAGRHKGDRWSRTELVVDRDTAWKEETIKHDLVTRLEIPRGRRVLYVHEGSMAHRAGVRRGDVIRAIDGIAIDRPDAPLLPERGAARLELVSARGEVREVTVTVTQVEWEQSTVSAERVIDVAGRKVGYVELHDFRAVGRDFRDAAERLRARDIQELVLDLRMNDSNRIRWSVLVASAIGGARLRGKLFLREVYNDRYRDLDYEQAFGPWSVDLSLPRVFIITSKDTCSASEALINGLAPHMEVVTVGSTTCGKPVGSSVVGYGEHTYSIITFRIMNARGDGDYYSGLRPTCPAEDDPTRELGDPEEASLKTTLHYIQHGRCPEPPLVSGLL